MKDMPQYTFGQLGPLVGAILEQIATDPDSDYKSFLTRTDKCDRLVTLTLADDKVDATAVLILPAPDQVDHTIMVQDITSFVTKPRFAQVQPDIKTPLALAGIGSDTHAGLMQKADRHPIAKFGEPLASRLTNLLNSVTPIVISKGESPKSTVSMNDKIVTAWKMSVVDGDVDDVADQQTGMVTEDSAIAGEPNRQTGT